MKYLSLFTAIFTLTLFAGCETSSRSSSDSSSASATGAEPIGKLYIEYNENNPEIRATGYNSLNNETDRFYYLKRNYEEVFKEELPEYELEFQRFPIKAPADATVLQLTFLSLRPPTRIELELRIWSKLKQGKEMNDFGITLSREVPQRPATSSSVDRDLDKIYSSSAKSIAEKVSGAL